MTDYLSLVMYDDRRGVGEGPSAKHRVSHGNHTGSQARIGVGVFVHFFGADQREPHPQPPGRLGDLGNPRAGQRHALRPDVDDP